jgi:hypothetical protein
MSASLIFLDPTTKPDPAAEMLSPFPGDQRQATVGLIDNSKDNSDVVLSYVADDLAETFGASAVWVRKKLPSAGIDHDDLRKLIAECDFVVSGVGDCGSCTTWSCSDAVEAERNGVPAILVCSETFAPLARSVARALGAASLRLAIVSHPVGGLTLDALRETDVLGRAVDGVHQAINGAVFPTTSATGELKGSAT